MKLIAMFLLLANVVFFAWSWMRPEVQTEAPEPLLEQGIILISEFEARPRPN